MVRRKEPNYKGFLYARGERSTGGSDRRTNWTNGSEGKRDALVTKDPESKREHSLTKGSREERY